MVMKRNMMRKNLYQSIRRSFGRYIAIVAIIALGSSLFVGLQMTKFDMVATGQQFTDEQNMFDLRLVSTYGWDDTDVSAVRQIYGLVDVEGVLYMDLIVNLGDTDTESVYRFYTLPRTVDRVALRGGRMPEAPDECLADGFHCDDSILGTQVTIADSNDETSLESVNYRTFTVVGYVSTPLYMDMNRGNTSVGSGSLASFFYVPEEAFNTDYYTEIHVTIPGHYAIFSDTYNEALEAKAESLEPLLEPLGQERFQQVLLDAEEAYAEGMQEYEDGLREYEEGKLEAERELADGYQALLDAQQQLDSAQQQIDSGWQQVYAGKQTLAESRETLETYEQLLSTAETTLYAPLESTKATIEAEMAAVLAQIEALDDQIAEIDAQLSQMDTDYGDKMALLTELTAQIAQLDLQIAGLDGSIQGTQAALEVAQRFPSINGELIAQLEGLLSQMTAQRASYAAQRETLAAQRDQYSAELEGPLAQRSELELQKLALQAEQLTMELELQTLQQSWDGVNESIALLDAEFGPIKEELESGRAQLEAGEKQIFQSERDLEAAEAALEEGRLELEQGWLDYEEGKAEAERELADAEQKLADAAIALADARTTIDEMDGPEIYVLDRNSNVGYASLDSNSDIVYSISKVLPAFFLLIAALVCITTMTRMIDEERTQIGTLKALGYGSGAIISKYLFYAGSGAVLGCGLGVTLGSVIFPQILWEAYCIILCIQPDAVLTFDWKLCMLVVGMYTCVILFVTWYSCHRTLKEAPAELIRPKAPEVGKQIFLEKLPLWKKISFLNKVTIRNIFRYRQRLAMMLVGIGGCTALLLTGFGLRDTIVNIADYQFEEVTVFDMQVYFSGGQTEEQQQSFRSSLAGYAEDLMFYHQESVDLEVGTSTREVYLMVADQEITNFVDFHSGEDTVPMPGPGELLLTVGVAEAMGVETGDEVVLRNADMRSLKLTVSGIYDNHVYNYAIVTPETVQAQWEETPEEQMALLKTAEDREVHEVSAKVAGLANVMNVSVSDDTAGMVGSMMDALDMLVMVIVICAGALAAIVLYNLTNININERIREIATIKVLGFNASETGAYVFKENLALTVMGVIVGLPLGRWFLGFVISQVKIDMVWFEPRAAVLSYVISVVMTILAALIVDFVFYFKLEKINMAEALKSVE